MNPNDMQNLMAQAEAAQRHAQLLGYSAYVAIITCAIFSTLIFWKLLHISDELRKFRIAYEMAEDSKARAAKPTPPRASDDSRYAPKS